MDCCRVMRGHKEDVSCLDFAAPNLLASGSHDAHVTLWNFGSGLIRSRLFHAPLVPQVS